jgi:hypothetical protein
MRQVTNAVVVFLVPDLRARSMIIHFIFFGSAATRRDLARLQWFFSAANDPGQITIPIFSESKGKVR